LLDHSGGHIHPLNLAIGEADAIRLTAGPGYGLCAAARNHPTPPGWGRAREGGYGGRRGGCRRAGGGGGKRRGEGGEASGGT
ncbi:hypothetical protein KCA24_05125, partial [Escherichia coli]|nr:hypothetical protein [Escherichia coli]